MANYSNHPTKAEREAKPADEPKKQDRVVQVELLRDYMPFGRSDEEGKVRKGNLIDVPRSEANNMIREGIARPPKEYFTDD